MDDPRAELERALELEDETERKLAVVAVIDHLVQDVGAALPESAAPSSSHTATRGPAIQRRRACCASAERPSA